MILIGLAITIGASIMDGHIIIGTIGEIHSGETVSGVIVFGDIILTGILTIIIGLGMVDFSMATGFGVTLGIIDFGITEIIDMEEELPTIILTVEGIV